MRGNHRTNRIDKREGLFGVKEEGKREAGGEGRGGGRGAARGGGR